MYKKINKKRCLCLSPGLASNRALPKKNLMEQTGGLCLQNQHSGDATFKVWFCWFTLNKKISIQQNKAVFLCLCKWGQCLHPQPDVHKYRAPQRLCRWLTWCAAASWLKHLKKCFTLHTETFLSWNKLLHKPKEEEETKHMTINCVRWDVFKQRLTFYPAGWWLTMNRTKYDTHTKMKMLNSGSVKEWFSWKSEGTKSELHVYCDWRCGLGHFKASLTPFCIQFEMAMANVLCWMDFKPDVIEHNWLANNCLSV